jgi:hypothetical protein
MTKIDLKNWTLWRATRMGLGITFAVAGGLTSDYILLAAGVFLIGHALINSCEVCDTGNCELPKKTTDGKFQ